MLKDTYSVSQIARKIGIAPNTIRAWSDDKYYGKHLSTHDRQEDDERRYTADDVALLQTVKVLRDQREPHKRILPRIANDERLEPPPEDEESPSERPSEDTDTAIMTEREARVLRDFAKLQGEYGKLLGEAGIIKQDLDQLRDQLKESQDQLKESQQSILEAETRAVAAEVRLDMIYRRHWWQVWRPERPQDAD